MFAFDYPIFVDNAGPWRLRVQRGAATMSRTDDDVRPIPIGTLSSLFSGYLRPPDAVRLGFIDASDPAVSTFEGLFAGADPWCPFFF